MLFRSDPVYYSARPRIAVPKERLLAADAMFGLHPALSPLEPMWRQGRLAAVHAAGLPAPNRSHFAAMEQVEDAAPGSSTRTGWLNRLLGTDSYASPLQGVAVGTSPFALVGDQPTLTVGSINSVRVAGAAAITPTDPRIASLARAWGGTDPMSQGLRTAVTAVADYGAVKAAKDAADTAQTTANAAVPKSTVTTAGDLIIATGSAAVTRLAIGANTYVLTSDGTTASWAAPSGGGSTSVATIVKWGND